MEAPRSPQLLPEHAALRAIVEGVEAETGDGFFRSLVQHLAMVGSQPLETPGTARHLIAQATHAEEERS